MSEEDAGGRGGARGGDAEEPTAVGLVRHHSGSSIGSVAGSAVESIESMTPSEHLMAEVAVRMSPEERSLGEVGSDSEDSDVRKINAKAWCDRESADAESRPMSTPPPVARETYAVVSRFESRARLSSTPYASPADAEGPLKRIGGGCYGSGLTSARGPLRLYEMVMRIIATNPGLRRADIRSRVASDYGRRADSAGATLSDPKFRPGGTKPLWLEKNGRFYVIAHSIQARECVNQAPILPPLVGCSQSACVVCGKAAVGSEFKRCESCCAAVHAACSTPPVTQERLFCCADCKNLDTTHVQVAHVRLYSIGVAFRRFAKEIGLELTVAETVVEARRVEAHQHSFDKAIWVAMGELTVSAPAPCRVRIGQVAFVPKNVTHSIDFASDTTYVYARSVENVLLADVDLLTAGIALREELHCAETEGLVTDLETRREREIRARDQEHAALRAENATLRAEMAQVTRFKVELKRKFHQLVDDVLP